MAGVLEVTIDVIVHATEDSSKFLGAFDEVFGLRGEEFSVQDATGHYENPITVLSARLRKRQAQDFMEVLLGRLSTSQKDAMVREIEERTSGSKFHLRLGKQEFLRGSLDLKESDAIRIKIHTPVYNKKDTVEAFREVLLACD